MVIKKVNVFKKKYSHYIMLGGAVASILKEIYNLEVFKKELEWGVKKVETNTYEIVIKDNVIEKYEDTCFYKCSIIERSDNRGLNWAEMCLFKDFVDDHNVKNGDVIEILYNRGKMFIKLEGC